MNLNLEKGKPVWKQVRRYKWYYILLLPIFTWYIIFNYGPMFGIAIAFIDYNPFAGILQSKWVGLHWFEYLFSNRMFFTALKNSLIINAYSLMFAFPAPIILALLLNECIKMERRMHMYDMKKENEMFNQLNLDIMMDKAQMDSFLSSLDNPDYLSLIHI